MCNKKMIQPGFSQVTLRALLVVFIILVQIYDVNSFSARPISRVVVSGAGSGVGKLVVRKLLKSPGKFRPIGLVENRGEAKELEKQGLDPNSIRICDCLDKKQLRSIFEDFNAQDGVKISKVVLCTSSKPKKKLRARIRSVLGSLLFWRRGGGGADSVASEGGGSALKSTLRTDDLCYEKGRDPYHVDFLGQKNLIDAATRAEVGHLVLLGSMGGYRGSSLNDIGRDPDGDNKKGNLLKWKRKAERYLIKRNFFTIVHAGPLTDDLGGQSEIVWDTDDALLRTTFKRISKDDCAEVLVQALLWKEAIGRSIDVGSRPLTDQPVVSGKRKYKQDWLRFWSMPGDNIYPVDEGFD